MKYSRTRHTIKFSLGLILIVVAAVLYQTPSQRQSALVIGFLGLVFASLHGIMLLIKK